MAIKRKPITVKAFIKTRYQHNQTLKKTVQAVDILNKRFVKDHCKMKVDEVIDIPDNVKEGYTQFKIGRITPEINEHGANKYSISYSLDGEFVAEGKEPLKGILKFKNQDNGKDEKKATS